MVKEIDPRGMKKVDGVDKVDGAERRNPLGIERFLITFSAFSLR